MIKNIAILISLVFSSFELLASCSGLKGCVEPDYRYMTYMANLGLFIYSFFAGLTLLSIWVTIIKLFKIENKNSYIYSYIYSYISFLLLANLFFIFKFESIISIFVFFVILILSYFFLKGCKNIWFLLTALSFNPLVVIANIQYLKKDNNKITLYVLLLFQIAFLYFIISNVFIREIIVGIEANGS